MTRNAPSDAEMREYALHHKHRHDAIRLLDNSPDRLPLWAVCVLLSPINDPDEHRRLATKLRSLTQTGALKCEGHPFHEAEPSHELELLRRTANKTLSFPEVKRDEHGKPSRDQSAYFVEVLREDVRGMLQTDGQWPLEDSIPLSRWFAEQNGVSQEIPDSARTGGRNSQIQNAANNLAALWKTERLGGFSKREIAAELARSDDWKEMTANRIERVIRVEW